MAGADDRLAAVRALLPVDFTGRHVVVFGGTSGINLGIARGFCTRGAAVTVASRKQANVDTAVAELATCGGRSFGIVADVRDEAAVAAALAATVARFGPIDVLVQGAAGNFLCEAKDLSSNGFKVVVDIDLNGTFNVMRQAFSHLRQPGASVINISAPQAYIPVRYQAHVCAAKAGVDQLTRVLALEWGPAGVRVNSISPGPIAGTEGVRRLMPSGIDGEALVASKIPLGRMGEREDIANLALFLASSHASFVSGTVIACDGGGGNDSIRATIEMAGDALPKKSA
jgi:NAD(P)-dependent dehydrogenase (short-subunit alcohol dehydrogenase family)